MILRGGRDELLPFVSRSRNQQQDYGNGKYKSHAPTTVPYSFLCQPKYPVSTASTATGKSTNSRPDCIRLRLGRDVRLFGCCCRNCAVPRNVGQCHKPTNATQQAVCNGPDDSLNYIVSKLAAIRGALWGLSQVPEKIAVLELNAPIDDTYEDLLRREVWHQRLGADPIYR
jgi:hypothetical protein